MKAIDWEKIGQTGQHRLGPSKRYAQTTCVLCGRTIHEGAYSGRDGNFRRHARACAAGRERAKVDTERAEAAGLLGLPMARVKIERYIHAALPQVVIGVWDKAHRRVLVYGYGATLAEAANDTKRKLAAQGET